MTNQLKFHRTKAGLYQKDVAQALHLDCADRISRWESGLAMPSVVNLFRLAVIYEVAPQDLYPELFEISQRTRIAEAHKVGVNEIHKGGGHITNIQNDLQKPTPMVVS